MNLPYAEKATFQCTDKSLTTLLVNTVDQNYQEARMTSNMLNVHSMLNASVFSPFLSYCSIFFLLSVDLTTPQHLHYSRAAPENSSAILCTIQEQITLSKKNIREACSLFQLPKQKWVLQTMPYSPVLSLTLTFSSKARYTKVFIPCVHTHSIFRQTLSEAVLVEKNFICRSAFSEDTK